MHLHLICYNIVKSVCSKTVFVKRYEMNTNICFCWWMSRYFLEAIEFKNSTLESCLDVECHLS